MSIDEALREAEIVCSVSSKSLGVLGFPDLEKRRMLVAATLTCHRMDRERDAKHAIAVRNELRRENRQAYFCIFLLVVVYVLKIVIA